MVSTSQTEGAHPCGAAPFRYRRAWKRNPGRGEARTAREKKRALRGTLHLKRHLPSGSSCPLNRGDNSRLYHNPCLTPDLGFASIRPAPLRGGFSWTRMLFLRVRCRGSAELQLNNCETSLHLRPSMKLGPTRQ